MSLSTTLAPVLVVLGATLAQAQSVPSRERRERSVPLTGAPLEAHIARGIRTMLVLGVPIQGQAIEVDRARIRIVDTGEHSLIIEPLSEPPAGERWTLRVPLAGGESPGAVEFSLVSHPSEVDIELDVAGRGPRDSAPQAACAPSVSVSPVDFVASGLIDMGGVRTGGVAPFKDTASGFELKAGVSYRGKGWVLVDVRVLLPFEQREWKPAGAALVSKTGTVRVVVRAVRSVPMQSRPRRLVRLLVEAEEPPPSAGLEFILHLQGPEGMPSFSIPTVTLSPALELQQ